MADSRYRSDAPLTYSYESKLAPGQVVTVPLQNRMVTGFVLSGVKKPSFNTKPVKSVLSKSLLPGHCIELAEWLKDYYQSSLGESLRQFAPSQPAIRGVKFEESELTDKSVELELHLEQPLTADQKKAVKAITSSKTNTVLLHGDTGTGKTRVYLELAKKTLESDQSVMMLTPEIALTSQLAHVFSAQLAHPIYVLHSQLTPAKRKKIWLAILESKEPVVVIGPRSALFSPIANPGLVILDEAHEPSYKQEQGLRYHAVRAASQLGALTDSIVVLGTATPAVVDYYLADARGAVVRMTQQAIGSKHGQPDSEIIDLKDRAKFKKDPYISDRLLDAIRTTVSAKKQVMIYLNRRGTARLILCKICGWQALCPNCDVPLVYHSDGHRLQCHICGHKASPPIACPNCGNPDLIYRSIGTKALLESLAKLFPEHRIQRFDSDNASGERIHELYHKLRRGEIDILVGTQVLAKGFDLPKLGLVGVIAAETSLALPDYGSEERSFQLLYQVMGRVGRGHGHGRIIVQTYDPNNIVVQSALKRDYRKFYEHTLEQRRDFRFPPFSFLMKLAARRSTYAGAEKAATQLAKDLSKHGLPVEIVGPTPSFYGRRGKYYYWQLVVKSKERSHLLKLAGRVASNWTIDLDPINLL